MSRRIYTIGHSNHKMEIFIELLQRYGITALVDVRSQPYSRYYPQFNKDLIQQSLEPSGIKYFFLGRELGARSRNPACYRDGKVQYRLLAQEPLFREGINHVIRAMENSSVALMCAEGDPLKCHRTVLVGRELLQREVELWHILPDGSLEAHEDTEKRLLAMYHLPEAELFRTHEEILTEAYAMQEQRIAYVEKQADLAGSEVHT